MGLPFQNAIFVLCGSNFVIYRHHPHQNHHHPNENFTFFHESTLLRLSDVSFRIEKAAIVLEILAFVGPARQACWYSTPAICNATGFPL